ncbi:MAG: hypothetical protein ABIG20_02090 [archaeon]
MKKLGIKGEVGGDVILSIVFVFIIFISAFALIGIGDAVYKNSAGDLRILECRKSLEFKNGWNEQLISGMNNAYQAGASVFEPFVRMANVGRNVEEYGTGGVTVGGNAGLGGAVIGGIVGVGVGAGVGLFDDTNIVKDAMKGAVNVAEYKTDTCVERLPAKCENPAEYAAVCVYEHIAKTYYGLGGGTLFDAKTTNEQDDNFYAYEMVVNITSPSTVPLYGDCSNYADNPEEVVSGVMLTETSDGHCNATISKLDERLITLVMISRCQRYGPTDLGNCKCFPSPEGGHHLRNGLHNNIISEGASNTSGSLLMNDDLYKNAPYPMDPENWDSSPNPMYSGCGGRFPGDADIAKYISIPQNDKNGVHYEVNIDTDPILIKTLFGLGGEKTVLIRLSRNATRVFVEPL